MVNETEYWQVKAENAQLKLERAEQKHKQEIAEIVAVVNELSHRLGTEGVYGAMCSHNIYCAIADISEKLGKGDIPYKVIEMAKYD